MIYTFVVFFLLKVANICNRKHEPDPSKYHTFSKMHACLFHFFKTRKITFFYFFIQIFNNDLIAMEIVRAMAASIGIILTVPIVAWVGSRIIIRTK